MELLAVGAWTASYPWRALGQLWNGNATAALFTLFVASELIGMAVNFWATRGTKHRHLWPWVPLMHFYFPLGCLAGWKAIYEVVLNPFYWDKTAHGVFDEVENADIEQPAPSATDIALPLLGSIGDIARPAAAPVMALAVPRQGRDTAPQPVAPQSGAVPAPAEAPSTVRLQRKAIARKGG